MIFNFNHSEELEKIKSNLIKIENIRNSLADHTEKYRDFCNDISTDFNVIKEIINIKSEYALLIDCYTFSERLLKNVVYECLDYTHHSNNYLNLFLDKKVDPEKFSPNVLFKEFEKELKVLNPKFSFLLNKDHSNVKIYDEMVKSRHRYAHANEYPFPYDNYTDAINVLEYLVWECKIFLNSTEEYGMLSKDYKELIEDTKKLKKIRGNKKLRNIKENESKKINIKEFRDKVRKFLKKYDEIFFGVSIFDSFLQELTIISEFNLNINCAQDLSAACINIGKEFH